MFKVRALVDVSQGALSHASEKFAIPENRTYIGVDDMLANASDIDLVMIMSAEYASFRCGFQLTPSEYHVEQTVKSLRAGKDVFVEKPMALSLEGAEEIERVQKETGKIVFVGFMRRYAEAFLRVKDVVQKTPKGEINYGACYPVYEADISPRPRHHWGQRLLRRRERCLPAQFQR